jgi:four helix bundle protein
MKQFSFEKLIVWQKSKDLSINIYKVTANFPNEEKFGLISQLRRCAVSVASNLAEGSGRNSNKDKARFSEIAFGSLLELLNQLIISNELKFLSVESYEDLRNQIEEISRMINALRKSQLNS